MKLSSIDLVFLLLFLALMGGITWGMFDLRARALTAFASGENLDEWNQWREAVEEGQADAGPVRRRVPRSAEPPTLVLLRDHFAVCLGGILLISAVLYGTLVFFIRGVLSGKQHVGQSS